MVKQLGTGGRPRSSRRRIAEMFAVSGLCLPFASAPAQAQELLQSRQSELRGNRIVVA
jgi:hypothetical protein